MNVLRPVVVAAIAVACSAAYAKLPPAPPMTDAQKAEAEAKKTATADKEKNELTNAQNRVAQIYIAQQKAKGVTVTPQLPSTGGSAEPQKPPSSRAEPEKAMAHSPPKKH
ncbi:MAG TPA: formate dehydrogenase [Casimicrobiaceae bacterium]|jgi:hypothetical protein|nr:formate dehydrogenase [Casimicrobiaceae bacterium]